MIASPARADVVVDHDLDLRFPISRTSESITIFFLPYLAPSLLYTITLFKSMTDKPVMNPLTIHYKCKSLMNLGY